jgi:hypothetical protein
MKALILKFLFLFYKYYDKGSTKSIAYQSSIMALMMAIFLNLYSVLIYTRVEDKYLTFSDCTHKWQKYLITMLFLLPIYFGMKKIFKKEDILKIEMDKPTMRKGYFIIVAYIILSMLMLTFIIRNK